MKSSTPAVARRGLGAAALLLCSLAAFSPPALCQTALADAP